MRRRSADPVVCALLACACGGGGPEAMPPGADAAARCAAFVEQGLALDTLTRAGLAARLGPAGHTEATTEPNRHIPDATDSLFTVTWPGLEVAIRTPPAGGDLVERVIVRDGRYLRWPEPGIGVTEARVVEVLGEPQERLADGLRYACGTGPVDEPVDVILADGRVREIVFAFYVD